MSGLTESSLQGPSATAQRATSVSAAAAAATPTQVESDGKAPVPPPSSPTAGITPPTKLGGYAFYRQALRGAKYIVAPMVDQSELAWRILSRRYGAELCYTPMFHARLFCQPEHKAYFAEQWQTNPADRPLIAQFCANDPAFLLRSALRIQDQCDAVDLNLGCPQGIAQKGHYGSFLMEEWDLVARMVRTLHENITVPVTCKIRVFPDPERTVAYARMLEAAGCQLLTVHGRLREQRGHKSGLADWDQIRRVKEAVQIPVLANGNILYFEDVERCLAATGVDGVMSAEANLYNPAVFSGRYLPAYQLAREYMDICKEVPTPMPFIRAHLFKLFKPSLPLHTDLRAQMAKVQSFAEMDQVVHDLQARLQPEAEQHPPFCIETAEKDTDGFYIIPHWICQPYVRPPFDPKTSTKKKDVAPTTTTTVTTAASAPLAVDSTQGVKSTENDLPPQPIADVAQTSEGQQPKRTRSESPIKAQKQPQQSPISKKPKPLPVPSSQSAAAADSTGRQGIRNKMKCRHCRNTTSVKCPHQRCKSCCRSRGLLPDNPQDIRDVPAAAAPTVNGQVIEGENEGGMVTAGGESAPVSPIPSAVVCLIHQSKASPIPIPEQPTPLPVTTS
ncbi:tRNA dihydrouridine synthase [Dimargaris cristalligena]|nr:tRNA dihydrouridine synthase [Dimargaris cristalligena]